MATITKGKTFTATEQVTAAKLHQLVDSATISGIINADVGASAAIADTKLAQITTANKVAAGAITDAALNVAALTCDSVASAGAITATTIGGTVGTLTGGLLMTQGTAPTTGATQGGLFTKDVGGEAELFYVRESAGTEVQITSDGVLNSGAVVQVVNTTVKTVATLAGDIPQDNSVPTSSEGTLALSRTITPTSATNELYVSVKILIGGDGPAMHLVKTGSANAVAAVAATLGTGAINYTTLTLDYYVAAGGTSEITFEVYAGLTTGTAYLNGDSAGTQLFGGVASSSITVMEIVV